MDYSEALVAAYGLAATDPYETTDGDARCIFCRQRHLRRRLYPKTAVLHTEDCPYAAMVKWTRDNNKRAPRRPRGARLGNGLGPADSFAVLTIEDEGVSIPPESAQWVQDETVTNERPLENAE